MNINTDGFDIRKNFVSKSVIESIKNEIVDTREIKSNSGVRNADKKITSIKKLADSKMFQTLATSILGSQPKIVRVIYFDKTSANNWSVPWHQDKTIALDSKVEISGWGPWTIKDGVHHVQPPIDVLNQMITFRLHLDDADINNGCLKVIPSSHQLGILAHEDLSDVVKNTNSFTCEVNTGDLLIMKPHLIHSSSKSIKTKHRRVIHIEYSSYELPLGLNWS